MQELINYIEKFVKLDSKAIAELYELAEKESFSKNQHLLEYGQYCNKIWFLKSGMVRKYDINEGKEITIWIYTENDTTELCQFVSQPAWLLEICKRGIRKRVDR